MFPPSLGASLVEPACFSHAHRNDCSPALSPPPRRKSLCFSFVEIMFPGSHTCIFSCFMGLVGWGPGDNISETAHERFHAIQLPDLSYVTRFFLASPVAVMSFLPRCSEISPRSALVSGGLLIWKLTSFSAQTFADITPVIIVLPPISRSF